MHLLLTGGAGGAGLVIAQVFARNGYDVSVCDLDTDALARLRSDQPGFTCIGADVRSAADVRRTARSAFAEKGPVDVLINNVGVNGPVKPIEAITPEEWNDTLSANITSYFLFMREVIPQMKERGQGCVINISSCSAKVGLPLRSPYVVSKAAVLSLTTNAARELGPAGIRVNAILPGAIRGPRVTRVIADKAHALGRDPDQHEREVLRFVSLRTMVEPMDIAEMALFLSSPAGSRITGQCIGVDGGVEWEE